MENKYNTCPVVDYDMDEKVNQEVKGQKLILDDEALAAIANLPELDYSGKFLLVIILSFAKGFGLSEKTLLEKSGMNERTLIRQRKKLNELGYLQYTPYKKYFVDLKKIKETSFSKQPDKMSGHSPDKMADITNKEQYNNNINSAPLGCGSFSETKVSKKSPILGEAQNTNLKKEIEPSCSSSPLKTKIMELKTQYKNGKEKYIITVDEHTLLKKYKTDYHYTEDGIIKTLEYFYIIKQHPVNQEKGILGIVPQYYIEAQQYYSNLAGIHQANSGKKLEEYIPSTSTIVKLQIPTPRPLKTEKPNDWLEEDKFEDSNENEAETVAVVPIMTSEVDTLLTMWQRAQELGYNFEEWSKKVTPPPHPENWSLFLQKIKTI